MNLISIGRMFRHWPVTCQLQKRGLPIWADVRFVEVQTNSDTCTPSKLSPWECPLSSNHQPAPNDHPWRKAAEKLSFDRLQAALRLPRPTILPAQAGVSRGAIGFADAQSAPLDAPSCALKFERSLCLGRADGKGVPSGNNQTQDCSQRKWCIPCGMHPTIRCVPSRTANRKDRATRIAHLDAGKSATRVARSLETDPVSSCALKLQYGLCVGIACGKGVPSGKR